MLNKIHYGRLYKNKYGDDYLIPANVVTFVGDDFLRCYYLERPDDMIDYPLYVFVHDYVMVEETNQ